MRKTWTLPLGLALLATLRLPGAIESTFDVPLHALQGSRVLVRLTFRDESGAAPAEPVAFQLVVTGSALFGDKPRTGKLTFGAGESFVGGETEGGVFEIEVDVPAVEDLTFDFFETSRLGVGPLRQTLFLDAAEGARPRFHGLTLGGPLHSWAITGATGERGWWSGSQETSRDEALISIPIPLPPRGKTFLRFSHRFGFEPAECLSEGKSHHGARVEAETAPGTWSAITPAEGYPTSVHTACQSPLEGQEAFGGSTGGLLRDEIVDLRLLAGRRARLRWRLATGCEECGAGEGWFIDEVSIVSERLSVAVHAPLDDTDGDGLSAAVELARGSDPRAADTDGDGLADSVETATGIFVSPVDCGSDPASPDSDGGGVTDGLEVALGHDPNDPASEPSRHAFDVALPPGSARPWMVRGDGSQGGSGGDPLEETFAGKGGFQLSLDRAPFPRVQEALGAAGPGGGITLGPETVGPFVVTRTIFASPDPGFIRYIETIENTSETRQEKPVLLQTEFFPKRWVEVEETSSGSVDWSPVDDHAHFNDRDPGDGMPCLLWLYSGPGARLEPREASLIDGVARLQFLLPLDPGERKAILYFAARSPGLESSKEMSRLLSRGGPEATALMTLADEAMVVNLGIDRDGDGIPTYFEMTNGLDPLDPRDAALDTDRDGLTHIEEFLAGSDPHLADTDGDGLLDGVEVKELKSNPTRTDTDGDGILDGVDPFPADSLIAEFFGARHALAGGTGLVEVHVTKGGELLSPPVRFTLTGSPDAVFQGPVEGGEVIQGLGSSEVLVEARGGIIRLKLQAAAPGRRTVRLTDSQVQGIIVRSAISEDFETQNGGFIAEGPAGAWKWGAPTSKPGAVSGKNVWGTGLAGAYPPNALDTLTTPAYTLAEGGTPKLEFSFFMEAEDIADIAAVGVSVDGAEFEILGEPFENTAGGYQRFSASLEGQAGKKVHFQFVFFSDSTVQLAGLFIDDFHLEGLSDRAVVDFLDPTGDADGDGLDNRVELEGGTDPSSPDTDADGLRDAVENGTGVFVDTQHTGTRPTEPDTDGGGENDGIEVIAHRDPNDPLDDESRILFEPPFEGIPLTDGGGTEWLAAPLGSALLTSDAFSLHLNTLTASGQFFFNFEGTLTFGKQILVLTLPEFFESPPVTRKLFVSRELRLLRWLEIFENPTATPSRIRVDLEGDVVTSSEPAEIVATGSGDLRLDPDDDSYIVRTGGEASPHVGFYLRNAASGLKPVTASFQQGSFRISYNIEVPAGGRRALCHFAAFSPNPADVAQVLDLIRDQDSRVLAGLKDDEIAILANFMIDSDGDGLPDIYERENRLDPADPGDAAQDPDGDGLSSLAERALGTDPQKADTDGDGLTDGREAEEGGTDPLRSDTDGDGIADGSDPLPLHRVVARQRGVTFGAVGEPTRLKVHLELEGRRSVAEAGIDLDTLELELHFTSPVEVLRAVRGEKLEGGGPDTYFFRPEGEWLVLDVRGGAESSVELTVKDRSSFGISGPPGSIHFLLAGGDTDGDGLPNIFEIAHGTDPAADDSDLDGILDLHETGSAVVAPNLEQGTFPWKADSDGGGSSDSEEMERGANPLAPADDLELRQLPVELSGAAGTWKALPSWALTSSSSFSAKLDNAGAILVNGKTLEPRVSALADTGGARVVFGPVSHGGLEVSRVIHASPRLPFLAFTEIVSNPGSSPVDARVELRFDMTADAASVMEATSSGDAAANPGDRWVLLRGGANRILHVFLGGESLKEVELREADLLREVFSFTVPPGGKRVLVHFLAVGTVTAEMTSLAAKLLDLREGALDAVPADALREIANAPGLEPILWDRFPDSPLAPGEPWSLAGEFLGSDVVVLAGGKPLEVLAALPDRIVLRAPGAPGEFPLEVSRTGGRRVDIPEAIVVGTADRYFDRGDVDENQKLNLTDVVRILAFLFQGGAAPRCADSADVDDSGVINLGDALILLQVLFQSGGPLPYPGGAAPGPDPTPDNLDC